MPPCCGTGCAVCVLDYWEPDEFELPALETRTANSDSGPERRSRDIENEQTRSDPLAEHDADLTSVDVLAGADAMVCCGTGCAVCVLDYPEYFSKQRSESETLAMLEAVEEAQRFVARLIANQESDSRQA